MTNLKFPKEKVGQNYCSSSNMQGWAALHSFRQEQTGLNKLLHSGGIQLTYHFITDVSRRIFETKIGSSKNLVLEKILASKSGGVDSRSVVHARTQSFGLHIPAS